MDSNLPASDLAEAEATYQKWLQVWFDHPADQGTNWFWEVDGEPWDIQGSPRLGLRLLIRLFERSEDLVGRYSNDQIGHGLWVLASAGVSNYLSLLLDETLPWAERSRAVRGIEILYSRLFARICDPNAGVQGTPANMICDMFWDLVPMGPMALVRPDHVGIEPTIPMDMLCLDVMERILKVPNVICQRGALHGLGHWHEGYPGRVAKIVDAFLEGHAGLPPKLREYAEEARIGAVQ